MFAALAHRLRPPNRLESPSLQPKRVAKTQLTQRRRQFVIIRLNKRTEWMVMFEIEVLP